MVQVFSCPANLASHRRWHKPATGASSNAGGAPAAKKPAKPPPTTKLPAATAANNNNNNNNVGDNDDDSLQRASLSPLSDDDDIAVDLSASEPAAAVSVAAPDSRNGDPQAAEPRPYECPSCGKTFRRRSYLRKHAATVHHGRVSPPPATGQSVPEQPAKSPVVAGSPDCFYCPDGFRAAQLERGSGGHVIVAGHGIRRLIRQREGVVEMEQRAADPSASYLCKYCPDSFASLSTLTGHVTANHSLDARQVAVMTM